jgi:orotidine-5'-phosphate decarboxylase
VFANKIIKGRPFLKVVPGIRPSWYTKKDDQKRIITPRKALESGADYIVIGRPVVTAKNPLDAVYKLFS